MLTVTHANKHTHLLSQRERAPEMPEASDSIPYPAESYWVSDRVRE
jgi:hypothetical protein